MGIENRRQRRLEVQLAATARGEGIYWDSTILNFCQGGLYVSLDSTHGSVKSGFRQPQAGERLVIEFNAPVDGRDRLHRMAGKVAHLDEKGFGFQYLQPDLSAWRGLVELHKQGKLDSGQRRAPATAVKGKRDVSRMLSQIDNLVQQTLIANLGDTCDRISQLLTVAASRSTENSEQQEFLRASQVLSNDKQRVIEDWLDAESKRIHNLPQVLQKKFKDTEPEAEEMCLVDQSSFDEWVAVVGLSNRLQGVFADTLYAIEKRFSELLGKPVDRETNPLDPAAFILSFVESVHSHHFNLATQRLLLGSLGKNLTSLLEVIYPAVNDLFVENGILPEVKLRAERSTGGGVDTQKKAESKDKTPTSNTPEGPATRRSQTGSFGSLRKMFTPAKLNGKAEDEKDLAGTEEVMAVLRGLGRGGGRSLKERIQAHLASGNSGGRMKAEVEGALDASDSLVAALRKDAKIGTELGDLIGQLDAPLARAALAEPTLFADSENPVAGFMQDLERLAVTMGGEGQVQGDQLKRAIEQTLDRLGHSSDAGSEAFATAREELAPLVDRAKRQFQTNIDRLRATKEGEDRLRAAHLKVMEAINQQLDPTAVPRILIQLLRLGWENLLVLGLLHRGGETSSWREYVDVIASLAKMLRPPARRPEPKEAMYLLGLIERGFSEAPSNPVRQQKFLEGMRKVLGNEQLFQQMVADTVPFQAEMPEKIARDNTPTDDEQRDRLAPFVETVRSINTGEWITERQESGRSRPLSMVWRDLEGENFAFVDGKGMRALETGIYDLATRLQEGELSILEDGGLPLVQRAVQDVLKKTYDQLLHNSETDSLTGLQNRRSFTKQLRSAVEQAVSDHSSHVLLLVDLDQFKLVNDICGHEGGDQLLREVTNILQIYLGSGVLLARIGDDEFGVLIRYCSSEDGFRIAETQRKAIENHSFNWGGRRLSVSCSVGLVQINDVAKKVDDLLKDVDTAVYLAKKEGRNRVKVFESEDREVMQHQDEIQAARLVEDAIQQHRLLLYVQLITPIFLDEGLSDHYEVLLRVLDEQGTICSPESLIRAAEGYDRMRSIDRWVIESLFNWIARNPDKVRDVGGFSINLSGQSVNSQDMLDFIKQTLGNTEFPCERIAFEITETAMIRDMGVARDFMLQIKQMGCEFYLDDFGSGLASYSYLKDLPVDCVKIDGSFIRNISTDENDYAMVKSITETAHFMKKRVIAEFVSDESIMIRLRELEVDYAQGWDVGKPFDLTRLGG